jgi:hypothetical protein
MKERIQDLTTEAQRHREGKRKPGIRARMILTKNVFSSRCLCVSVVKNLILQDWLGMKERRQDLTTEAQRHREGKSKPGIRARMILTKNVFSSRCPCASVVKNLILQGY